jgi:STAS-like domain of unknown function (DUF4325)
MIAVNVADEFTRFPAGRLKIKGSTSGEAFRERFLEKPLREGLAVTVNLDGTVGYGSSFLEEAFGGLVRVLDLGADRILSLLKLNSSDGSLIEEIEQYIRDADRNRKR